MIIPVEDHLKYPPRSFQTLRESPLSATRQPEASELELPEVKASFIRPKPAFTDYFAAEGFHTSKLVRQPKFLDDWSWEVFSIGVGAGAIHIMIANLNSEHRRLIMCLEVFFYCTDVISFLCNMAILMMQYIRESWRLASEFEHPEKSLFVSLIPINIATICVGSFRYGLAAGWLEWGGATCWFHCYIVLLISILTPQYLMWFKIPHFLEDLPSCFFLLPMPFLLTGVMAVYLLNVVPSESEVALHVLLIGYLFGGLGITLGLFCLFIYFLQAVLHGHGNGKQTAGSLLAAAIPAFGAYATIGLGNSSRIIFVDSRNMKLSETLGEVWYGGGLLTGVILLGLSLTLVFIAASNSWWKIARSHQPNSTLWMISTTCCSWAVSSACGSLNQILESAFLKAAQIFFIASGIVSYLTILILMIIKYFKRISRSHQPISRIFPSTHHTRPSNYLFQNTKLQDISPHHLKFVERDFPLPRDSEQPSISKHADVRDSVISQDTLVKAETGSKLKATTST